MMCAMCGKEGSLVVAIVEGTELKVCEACSRYGKVLREVRPQPTRKDEKRIQKNVVEPERLELVVKDCASIVRNKREALGLKQSEFAKMMNEKESLIQNLETSRMTPSLALARKFEKILKVKLIEQYEDERPAGKKDGAQGLTLGDIIKVRK